MEKHERLYRGSLSLKCKSWKNQHDMGPLKSHVQPSSSLNWHQQRRFSMQENEKKKNIFKPSVSLTARAAGWAFSIQVVSFCAH